MNMEYLRVKEISCHVHEKHRINDKEKRINKKWNIITRNMWKLSLLYIFFIHISKQEKIHKINNFVLVYE
jgi:hypothetical protein